jgi:hypothetical protein
MSNFDPTTNRIPFGLLSEYEQKALKAWPHGWEYHHIDEWRPITLSAWCWNVIYRGTPAPVVTSQWFIVYPYSVFDRSYPSREKAERAAGPTRIAVLRIDTCNGVSTAHLEEV